MRLAIKLLAAAVALAAAPTVAHAQAPTNDPEAGSPSGTIYEIPLDDGRKDAAPTGTGGGGADGAEGGAASGGGATGGSTIHSENDFGSSSTVPGAEAAPAQGAGPAAMSGTGSRDRSSGREKRAKSTRDDGLTAAQERAAAADVASVAPGPSTSRAALLIGLGIAVAVGLGGAAARLAAGRR